MIRFFANLITSLLSLTYLIFKISDADFNFFIFSLPYVLSNTVVLIMLVLSWLNKPKDVMSDWGTFFVSVTAANLGIIIYIFDIGIISTNRIPELLVVATILSFIIVPFYIYAVFTLGKSLTVLPEAHKLKTTGMYRITRHPLYFTYIYWYILQVVICQSWIAFGVSLIQISLQLTRARKEEAVLSKVFPEYKEYRKKVGWFFKLGVSKS